MVSSTAVRATSSVRWRAGSGRITLGRDQIRSACPHRGSPRTRRQHNLFPHESSPRGWGPLDARPLPRRHRPVTRAAAFRRGAATSADARKASSSARIPPGRHVPVNSTRRLRNSPDRCSPVAGVLKWERRCREPDGPGTHTFAAPAAPGMSMTDKSTSWNKLLRSPRARIRPHEHHAGDDAVLFRVTDAPLLDALGFLRST